MKYRIKADIKGNKRNYNQMWMCEDTETNENWNQNQNQTKAITNKKNLVE